MKGMLHAAHGGRGAGLRVRCAASLRQRHDQHSREETARKPPSYFVHLVGLVLRVDATFE